MWLVQSLLPKQLEMDKRCLLVVLLVALVGILYALYTYSSRSRPTASSPGSHSKTGEDPTAHLQPAPSASSTSHRNLVGYNRTGSKFGYVFASSYFDQVTGSMANFLSMQCWGGTLGRWVRVVEPFLVHSTYGFNITDMVDHDYVSKEHARLRDLFDMKAWKTRANGFSPLVGWDFFLKYAPQDLIVVDRDCIHRRDPIDKCADCIQLMDSLKFSQSITAFAEKYDFAIVRKICVPPAPTDAGRFRSLVYGPHNPEKVTVVFESWGGIQQAEYSIRMGIHDLQQCERMALYWTLPVSPRIVKDGEKYVQKFMPTAQSRGYVAVMIRLQYIAIMYSNFAGLPEDKILHFLRRCFGTVQIKVNAMKTRTRTQSVLLTTDSGKQGSYYFLEPTPTSKLLTHATDILYNTLFGNSSASIELENSFDVVASFNNPGYIATLQRHLAANSSCLLTVGTGSFQMIARSLYGVYHSDTRTHCMDSVDDCGNIG